MTGYEAAIRYLELGWQPLPIQPRGKRPHFELLKAVYDTNKTAQLRREISRTEVETWFEFDPDLNIAIQTGPVSHGLTVLDRDTRNPGVPVPSTPLVKTHRGDQLYLQSRKKPPIKKFAGGEVIHGGYVVAPPSEHPDGGKYGWRVHPDLADPAPFDHRLITDFLNVRMPRSASRERARSATLAPETGSRPIPSDLAAWDAYPPFVEAACDVLGMPIDRGFRCILPGHDDQRPSASLFREPIHGTWVYMDFHRRDGPPAFLLAEVYAAVQTGEVRQLPNHEAAAWKLRLLVDTGFLPEAPVVAPPLPRRVSTTVAKVYEGFIRLVALLGSPVCFSWRFAAEWCGTAQPTAGRAIHELMRLKIIRIIGKDDHGRALFEVAT